MIIQQRLTVDADRDRVWDFLMDIPSVARCLPGVESVTPLSGDRFAGVFRVKIGPISARLEGTMTLAERDDAAGRARMEAQGSDRLLGGAVNAKMTLQVETRAEGGTDLGVVTDVAVLGKLGQFGQAIIKRQADQTLAEFGRNLSGALAAGAGDAAPR